MSDPTRKRLLERGPNGKPSHPYTRSGETDVAKTFARIKRQQKDQAAADKAALEAENVKPILTKRRA